MCSLGLRYATKVTLIPHPDSDGRFAAWDGPCAAAGTGPCTVRVGSPLSETAAAFGHSSPHAGDQPLTVTLHNSFPRVTSRPAGIVCPPTCQASFPSGTIVTLLTYDGIWAGACTGETLQRCALVIDAPTEVGVAPAPPPPLPAVPRRPRGYVDVTVSGAGLVTSSDGQIQCGFSPRPSFHCHKIRPAQWDEASAAGESPTGRSLRPLGRLVPRKQQGLRARTSPCWATTAVFPLTGLFRSTRPPSTPSRAVTASAGSRGRPCSSPGRASAK